jgi:dTDP-4-amino-4,6-dideoxygalactose transaminase
MRVPFLDIQAQNRSIWTELQQALEPVISEAQFILGPAVERFEAAFADYVGVKHCIGLNNGTSALHMALKAFDIGAGDEVITTPHTWISTSWAISYVGARPVFVDIDPVTYTLDPDRVSAAITSRTKAILPVHLYGQAADVIRLREIADRHGLLLIEDAAQAHGAEVNGRRVGSFGHAGCFSFYPGKNLGAFGESGAVTTDDSAIAARIRRLRDHAQDGRHNHVELGFNTRMEGVQGAVLAAKLPHLDGWNSRRREHAERYREQLKGADHLELPTAFDRAAHVWHLFVVQVQGMNRENLRMILADKGIGTAVHYPVPVPFQPAYAYLGHKSGEFPVAERLTGSCLSIPMFPELTGQQIEQVSQALRAVL